ncbi:MAG: hypothetical protein GW880_34305, partial [Armatimonadetes bacterium]|nr:hypothetical protein [Armatimonadota bacterium]
MKRHGASIITNVITSRRHTMHVSLVQIGNSRGIRIPKRILDQCEIT